MTVKNIGEAFLTIVLSTLTSRKDGVTLCTLDYINLAVG